MRVITAKDLHNQRVLLRMDLDVPIADGRILEDFRLKAGLPTLELCLQNAASVVICGHIGRPKGQAVEDLSVAPIVNFIEAWYCDLELPAGRLHVLENLRFEKGEEDCDLDFAKELAKYGDIYINEAFAAHHQAASTTVITKLLPSFAGLRFDYEVKVLTSVRETPKKPLVAIVGGAKVEDKYPAIIALSKFCDAVLVGGLLPTKIKEGSLPVPENVILGKIASSGIDIDETTIKAFEGVLQHAKQVIWGGPVGKYEEKEGNIGTLELAKAVLDTKAEVIIGGGDSITALNKYLDQFSFVSTGGGAMLKLLCDGTLPTIQALDESQASLT